MFVPDRSHRRSVVSAARPSFSLETYKNCRVYYFVPPLLWMNPQPPPAAADTTGNLQPEQPEMMKLLADCFLVNQQDSQSHSNQSLAGYYDPMDPPPSLAGDDSQSQSQMDWFAMDSPPSPQAPPPQPAPVNPVIPPTPAVRPCSVGDRTGAGGDQYLVATPARPMSASRRPVRAADYFQECGFKTSLRRLE